jgi:hypothetical protein
LSNGATPKTTPGQQTSPSTKLPAPLTTTEKLWSALLVVLGVLLTVGVLIWFGATTEGGGLKSKVTKITEPVGQNPSGQKVTDTTDYADTVVIFALTAGAAFILAGAFYGRLREIKLGALTLGLGELPPDKEQQLDEKIEKKVEETAPAPEKKEAVRAAAQSLARRDLQRQYWGVFPSPPDDALESAASTAVAKALSAFGD